MVSCRLKEGSFDEGLHGDFSSFSVGFFEIVKVEVAQSCPTLCDPRDYTVCGILQARILEWVAFPFSRGSSQPKGSNLGLPHCRDKGEMNLLRMLVICGGES